jgi:hypothetical protein
VRIPASPFNGTGSSAFANDGPVIALLMTGTKY